MAILFLSKNIKDFSAWKTEIHAIAPELELRTWDNPGLLEDIDIVLAWNPPEGIFPRLPNLKLVQSLSMGIDHLLKCPDFNQDIAVTRIIDSDMKIQMSEYVYYGVLKAYRNFQYYGMQKTQHRWKCQPRIHQEEIRIGILGLGELGLYVANTLIQNGFSVSSWSLTAKDEPDIKSYHGENALIPFLRTVNILVCLLPLTQKTQNILNYAHLKALPEGAFIINPARGAHLVDEDLLQAIDEKHISGALLDVFRTEPLPQDHPFWASPCIEITPHIAASTNPATASLQIVNNVHRLQDGEALLNQVDLTKEY